MGTVMLKALRVFDRFRKPKKQVGDLSAVFRARYERFKELLDSNAELSKIIADIEEKLLGYETFGMSYLRSQSTRAIFHTYRMVNSLDALSGQKYPVLFRILESINGRIKEELAGKKEQPIAEWILPYSRITREMVDWVGGKNANLGEVLNRAHLPIPSGFAITTRAFEHFMTANDLVDEINKKKLEFDPKDPESTNALSEEIQRLIISAPVPRDLEEAILEAYDRMTEEMRQKGCEDSSLRVSLRSSAIGEDSELSFAGQYLSVLNVPREKLIQTYGYILASLFTPRAISYRLNKGIRHEDVAMSVACLEMVNSVASGVMYSRHPFNPLNNNVIITAVWGLGPYAVDGIVTPDSYTVGKEDFKILDIHVSNKPVQLLCNPDGGLRDEPVPAERQDAQCLSEEQIKLLASYAVKLEDHYGYPQDIEWALNERGDIIILQARPLRLEPSSRANQDRSIPELSGYELLIEGGAIACPGVGYGTVFQVHSDEDLLNFPEGSILVARHSSPKFVVVMQRTQAIITDSGSVTGHMASLSREFEVPTILDAKTATTVLKTGMEITVDAHTGRIYRGKVPELLSLQETRKSHMKGTPVFETLEHLAELIVPLHLFDPKSSNFTPEHCESLHDIMRLVHEFSYKEMFRISDMVSNGGNYALKLDAPVPLDLFIIDLGGGLKGVREGAKKVKVDQIQSVPFNALLKGMLHEDLRFHRPRPVELKGFFSVMSEQMLSSPYTAERFGDRSYAIISDKYLNFSSRVGYHYGILDSYCGRTLNKNYITFSFKGGAADDIRRNRRARAIGLILKELGFTVETVADRVDARLQKYEAPAIQEKLDIIGRLLLFTRQMDMLMHSEGSVAAIAEAFMKGDYHLEHLSHCMGMKGNGI